jgi:hypothetical protein
MTTGRFLPGPILGLILLAACQPGAESESAADADGADAEKTNDDTPAIPVETSVASRADIYAMYSGTAPIEALAEAEVIAKVAGEIREILVEEGDDVRSGQVLARLDGDRLRLELKQAEANLRKSQRDYQRNVDLKKKSLISAGDFEKIKYETEALEATYNLARLEYSYTEIRAPIDGVISGNESRTPGYVPACAGTRIPTHRPRAGCDDRSRCPAGKGVSGSCDPYQPGSGPRDRHVQNHRRSIRLLTAAEARDVWPRQYRV